jgi:hypothetical protein
MASAERIQYHNTAGHDFMEKAWKYLDEGDLAQASEKGWGAAAQMVKATAETREWRHNAHAELYRAVDRLADESGDEQLRVLFHSASSLHINFYEGWMPRRMVQSGLVQVGELVAKLERLQS